MVQLVVVCQSMVCVKDVMRTEVTTNKTKPMVRDFKFFEIGIKTGLQSEIKRNLEYFLDKNKQNNILEIGCYEGMSSTFFADNF